MFKQKLLEVIRTPQTSAETFTALKAFGVRLGKHVIECKARERVPYEKGRKV